MEAQELPMLYCNSTKLPKIQLIWQQLNKVLIMNVLCFVSLKVTGQFLTKQSEHAEKLHFLASGVMVQPELVWRGWVV